MALKITRAADPIPVERLTEETWITAPSGAARAIAIRFDGYGYGIDLRYGQSDDGYEEYLYVDAGGSVEFAGVGEPKLRGEQFVPADEVEAKAAALNERALGDVTNLILRSVEASTRMDEYRTAAE